MGVVGSEPRGASLLSWVLQCAASSAWQTSRAAITLNPQSFSVTFCKAGDILPVEFQLFHHKGLAYNGGLQLRPALSLFCWCERYAALPDCFQTAGTVSFTGALWGYSWPRFRGLAQMFSVRAEGDVVTTRCCAVRIRFSARMKDAIQLSKENTVGLW